MKDEIKFKRPETKIENILEKGKKLENFINSIYDNNLVIPQELNPFNIKTSREPQNDFDTLDKIELLEYSREMEMNTKEDKDREISQSNDTEQSERNFNIKDYDNFIFKIETLKISDEKTFKVLKDDLLYLECKVPLYANEGIYHDTFK